MEECLEMLADGETDVYLALDSYGDLEHNTPIALVGYSDFYFAVNKARTDLLNDLNGALNMIRGEDRYFNDTMAKNIPGRPAPTSV